MVRTGCEVTEARLRRGGGVLAGRHGHGETHEADVLVSAVGQLSNPVVPDMPGREHVRRPGVPLRAVAP